MPGLTPGRRFQPAYFSFKRQKFSQRALAFLERRVKGMLFGCRMCGNCLLQETAFICPMECAKGLRNGPCGGSSSEKCYADPTRPCIWYRIYERAAKMGRTQRLLEVLPPLNWSQVGQETWGEVVRKIFSRGPGRALKSFFSGREKRRKFWNELFYEIRQPDWWRGDDQPHPPAPHPPVSKLEELLAAGKFVVTAEIAPPITAKPDEVVKLIKILKDYIDAANFTDNPSATPRMSSLACSVIAVQNGMEPVMQIAARDRNRMGLQGEILGATALGVRNVLCLTGDHSSQGPLPHGRMDTWDLDAIQMLWLLRKMRDERQFLDGRPIKNPPPLFLGAAASPFASTPRIQALRELKKFQAGAQFFQSNLVYDLDGFKRYLEALDQAGLLGKIPLLAGITPVRSARAAHVMSQVPGVKIPAALIERLEKARDPKEEGVQITLEIIEQVRQFPGVSGFHFMAVGWELIVPRLVREAGLKEIPEPVNAQAGAEKGAIVNIYTKSPGAPPPPEEFSQRQYLDALREKVLVFDGALGTSIQKLNLQPADFGGEQYAGCNDYLVIRKPEVIEKIHASFLETGCDVIETCTFRANRLTMSEYGLQDKITEINRQGAELARRAADRFSSADHPRFVAGSMGPTGKLPSSADPELTISFPELVDVYCQQAIGLIQGGCDLLIVETSQDMLEVKAAIIGIQQAFGETQQKIPLQAQVTMDAGGRMLLGTDISAVLATLERMPVDVIGLNCSTGPEQMRGALAYLGEHSSKPLSCMPNAGLPLNVNGQAVYPLEPHLFAGQLAEFVNQFGLNVVGGCCGTTPEHIRQLVHSLAGIKPRGRNPHPLAMVSSGITAAGLAQNPPPMLIGERMNAQGSKKMKELLLADDDDGIAALAREQMEGGAHTLDICVAMTERRDEAALMSRIVKKLSQTVEAPLSIDTTEAEVLSAALQASPGRVLVNAVNMENGRKRLDAMLPLIRDYGAATIALTIDENGMARTAERKLEVARKIYDIATGEYGLLPDALIFDALTFTLATGDADFANSAVETLEGIKKIKSALPGVLTSLGVSNVSYGFKPAARGVLNSAFLYHAVNAGLDMAIVNPKQITPYADIPAEQRELADDLLLNRRPDAAARFISFFEGLKARDTQKADPSAQMSPAQRLHWRIFSRKPDGAEADLTALVREFLLEKGGSEKSLENYPNPETSAAALRILNQVLLPAMKEVGEKFGTGELILPFVLQSAEVMKKTVSLLEKYLEKTEGVSKGKIVLATVYGDVHDIGKNLVKTILVNNGYTVHDLGKQVPVSVIVDKAVEVGADIIGLSALLVSTSRQMPLVVRELHQRGLNIPVLVGGAAINPQFGRDIQVLDNDQPYAGGVFYCKDVFAGLEYTEKLADPAKREQLLSATKVAPPANPQADSVIKEKATDRLAIIADAGLIPQPPFWGSRKLERIPLEQVWPHLDQKQLFRLSWGAKNKQGAEWEKLKKDFVQRLRRMKKAAVTENWFNLQALYGYFPVHSEGNDLLVYDPASREKIRQRFVFPRQAGKDHLCLADYFLPLGSTGHDLLALQIVTVGRGATALFEALDEKNEYSESYFFHGLAVQTAEATAAYLFERIRSELKLSGDRGKRYSWGFGALPDVTEHQKLFQLLPAQKELGMSLTSAGQLIPEQSTAALIIHHPDAAYFKI